MKNMLGDEVTQQPLTFEWMTPNEGQVKWHLTVLRGKKLFCMVHPNGWTGHSITIGHKFGEPIIANLQQNVDLSFADVKAIMEEYHKELTPRDILNGCIAALAKEKKLSTLQAVEYILAKKIECILI